MCGVMMWVPFSAHICILFVLCCSVIGRIYRAVIFFVNAYGRVR